MRIIDNLATLPPLRNPVVTLGTFDGVHKGHQAVIRVLNGKARDTGGESVLLTFWPHPRLVLGRDAGSLRLLNTLEEKQKLLEESGLDNLVIVEFTPEFAKQSYDTFVRETLVGKVGTKVLAVGHDHHFGRNREGSFEQLKEMAPQYGFELLRLEAVSDGNVNISSTAIRNALLNAELDKANEWLGYPYMLSGEVVKGDQIGRTLGFPTANIKVRENFKLVPADGIYIVLVDNLGKSLPGMASLGYRPTFNGKSKTIEVNILNFNDDLYGKNLTVRFLKYLRPELNFANSEALVAQMQKDKSATEEYFM